MTAVIAAPVQITEPGVYDGMRDDVYHSDPVPEGSLSSSGAKLLLPPSCPAKFRYEQDHGRAPKRAFDFGHAAHHKVLGVGPEIVVVDADNWRTKAAQVAQKEAYAAGKVPLLAEEAARVDDMAAALRAHPFAAALFAPESGKPEQSLFWFDEEFGAWRRARLDWLRHSVPGKRFIVPDYKSCDSASPEAISKALWNYGYCGQADWYLTAVRALELGEDPQFVFVFQEKTPPYLVTVAQPDAEALLIGRDRNRRALEVYRDCVAADSWPGYSQDVELISLPGWAANRHHLEESW